MFDLIFETVKVVQANLSKIRQIDLLDRPLPLFWSPFGMFEMAIGT
jgi:hypothetical protein